MSFLDRRFRFRVNKSSSDIDATLRYMVRQTYRDVAVYRQAWREAGRDPEEFRGQQDLARLPIMEKRDLVAAGLKARMRTGARLANCVRRGTSGATGSPIDIYLGRAELWYRQLTLFSAIGRNIPLRRPARIAEVGAWVPPGRDAQKLVRSGWITALHIPRTLPVVEQIKRLQAFRPRIVTGCPSSLELVAQELQAGAYAAIAPELVVSRGECLFNTARRRIAQGFGCRVVDYYSVQEVGNVAWECPLDPSVMHINTDICVVEVVDDEGRSPEGEGKVVVTNLCNLTMPFIRYAIGDRATLKPHNRERCRCGARGPAMRPPAGREDAFVVLGDGRRVSPRHIDDLVMDCLHTDIDPINFVPESLRYHVHQRADGVLEVRLAARDHVVRAVAGKLPGLLQTIDRELVCEVLKVAEIAEHPSGKVSVVSSEAVTRQGMDRETR